MTQMQNGLCSAQQGQYSENEITYRIILLFTDKETESQRYCVTCPRSQAGKFILPGQGGFDAQCHTGVPITTFIISLKYGMFAGKTFILSLF